MLLEVFAIYDSAVSTWRSPMFAKNTGSILRDFADAVNDPQTVFSKHPGDYSLFRLGTWNDDTCEFDLLKAPVRLAMALDFVKIAEPLKAVESPK